MASHLVRRHAVHRDDPGAQADGTWCTSCTPGWPCTSALERAAAGRSGCRRRRSWARWPAAARRICALHVALDQRDGGQRGQAEPGGHQHQRGGRARPVQVGEAEPHRRRSATRRPAGPPASPAPAASRNSTSVIQAAGAEPQREAPVRGVATTVSADQGRRQRGVRRDQPAGRHALASGSSQSRNSAAPGMRAARPSGQSAKQSAVSSP